MPASSNAAHYARIVREMATLRGLVRAGSEIARLGFEREGMTAEELVDKAEQTIFDLSQERVAGEFTHIEELLKDSFERITALYEAGADVTGMASGYKELDRLTSGFQPGNLIIVAARPSMGKSAFGLCVGANLAVRQNVPVAMFTLEMSKLEVTQRLMCSEAKVESQRLRTGKLAQEDWPRLTAACDKLAKAPIYVDDTGSITLMEIRSKARRLKMREPNLGLIIIDYLQLMTSGTSAENRVQEVSQISRSLKVLARDLDVPIIAHLAALPRSRAAPRQAADPLRPARVRVDRAGRRPRHVHLPRRVLQRRGVRLAGPRRGAPGQAPERADRPGQALVPAPVREVRRPGARRDEPHRRAPDHLARRRRDVVRSAVRALPGGARRARASSTSRWCRGRCGGRPTSGSPACWRGHRIRVRRISRAAGRSLGASTAGEARPSGAQRILRAVPATVIVGAQWGDEGKGKIVDLLAQDSDLVCRYNGGPNAGHTIVAAGETCKLRHMPSGILWGKECVIGAGCVVDPGVFIEELDEFESRGISTELVRLSGNAHVIMPWHLALDQAGERRLGKLQIGTTRRGIGPTYADKAYRLGIRLQDLFDPKILRQKIEVALAEKNVWLERVYGVEPIELEELAARYEGYAQRLRPYLADTSLLVERALREGRAVLLEGAHGTLLDIDHGTYPFVTSSPVVAGGACTGIGIGPTRIDKVVGIAKAYVTRVGAGPFPTEIEGPDQERLRELGGEFGTVTGRERRCGWLDLVALRYAVRLNGITSLALTKLDVLSAFDELPVCVAYELRDGTRVDEFPAHQSDFHTARPVYETLAGWEEPLDGELPDAARRYVEFVERALEVEVSWVGTGAERERVLVR